MPDRQQSQIHNKMNDFVKFGGVLFHKSLVTFDKARNLEPQLSHAEYLKRIDGVQKETEVLVTNITNKKKEAVQNKPEIKVIKPRKKRKK